MRSAPIARLFTTTLLAVLPFASACDDRMGELARYSIAADDSEIEKSRFPRESPVQLRKILDLGRPDGPEHQVFGFVVDAGIGKDGSTYVVDSQFQHVAVFDSIGTHRRSIGKRGSGPGEFLAPAFIAVFDSTIAVFDRQLGTTSVFDTAGVFRHSFFPPSGWVLDLEEGPQGTLLLTAFSDSTRVFLLTSSGKLAQTYIKPPKIDGEFKGPYVPDPGRVCATPQNDLVYANSWIYELAKFDVENGKFKLGQVQLCL